MQKIIGILAAGMFAAFSYASAYTITDLGALAGNGSESIGINNRGDIIGQGNGVPGTPGPFLYIYKTHHITVLKGFLNEQGAYPAAINDFADVSDQSKPARNNRN
jgi:hypothetical protein